MLMEHKHSCLCPGTMLAEHKALLPTHAHVAQALLPVSGDDARVEHKHSGQPMLMWHSRPRLCPAGDNARVGASTLANPCPWSTGTPACARGRCSYGTQGTLTCPCSCGTAAPGCVRRVTMLVLEPSTLANPCPCGTGTPACVRVTMLGGSCSHPRKSGVSVSVSHPSMPSGYPPPLFFTPLLKQKGITHFDHWVALGPPKGHPAANLQFPSLFIRANQW
jgi:hypothetical protein